MEGVQGLLKVENQKQGGGEGVDLRHLTHRRICYHPDIFCNENRILNNALRIFFPASSTKSRAPIDHGFGII